MLLHTTAYLLFLGVVTVLYWIMPGRTPRKALLLAASYVFYALFDLRFAALLFALTAANHFLGRAISRSKRAGRFVWLSVLIHLAVLAVFKYAGFFLDSAQAAFEALGIGFLPPALNLLLPFGISFYTFQGISYSLEIYRKKIEPAGSFIDLALYLAFFPKLIAGPLVRPTQFFAQLSQPAASLSQETAASALRLLVLGLVKKILIADSLAGLADVAFRAADLPSGGASFPTPLFIQGFYLYAFQIYADFSGYTDIARASAALLGFSLPENFQQPYLSATLTTFWNRWHMTLTQWFREVLFYPLSRALLKRVHRKSARWVQIGVTLVTMASIGLWHGAAWTFVAWGAWHGVLLTIEQALNLRPARGWRQVLQGFLTFHLAGVGWVLFGSSSFQAAGRFLAGLAAFDQMTWLPHYLPSILLTGSLVFGIDLAGRLPISGCTRQTLRPVLLIAGLVVIAGLLTLSLARGGEARPFIYGRF